MTLRRPMVWLLTGLLALALSPGVPDDVDLHCNRVATR